MNLLENQQYYGNGNMTELKISILTEGQGHPYLLVFLQIYDGFIRGMFYPAFSGFFSLGSSLAGLATR
jgi:hypothetical protein